MLYFFIHLKIEKKLSKYRGLNYILCVMRMRQPLIWDIKDIR